jgi:hypothetical protein
LPHSATQEVMRGMAIEDLLEPWSANWHRNPPGTGGGNTSQPKRR